MLCFLLFFDFLACLAFNALLLCLALTAALWLCPVACGAALAVAGTEIKAMEAARIPALRTRENNFFMGSFSMT